jgi:hypothetical protein
MHPQILVKLAVKLIPFQRHRLAARSARWTRPTNHPRPGKRAEDISNGNCRWRGIGYPASLGAILVCQGLPILAAGLNQVIVVDLDFERVRLNLSYFAG